MEKKAINNIRLGIFLIAGLLILVVSLYMIGQNHSFFGSNFSLSARFRNVNGLMPGNNVRFSGIQCGTVNDIKIINDTTIEVHMLISQKTSPYIRSDARAAIGNEGLMGNKVINIFPGTASAPVISDGGMLRTGSEKGFNDMLDALSVTSDNVLDISLNLKESARRINNSPAFSELLADTTLATNLHQSLENFRHATAEVSNAAATVNHITGDVRKGKGAAGVLLSDPEAAVHIKQSLEHLHNASEHADKLVSDLDSLTQSVHTDMDQGRGVVHLLLKDSSVSKQVKNSLGNIEKGTGAFNEDMEALKHNFLFRRYFKKQKHKKGK